ncbi:tetratricopeptide repeat protein [Microbispora sp. NBC_01189]|uniref:ATP-binding protein n=1 Tax=Microbispora sp. NBC_01189 TaxID=2903583 RepID=UPI002E131F15|nr:tetratricopeptide repeat protein [Microbispora sp. NBC_01189]
MAAPAGWRQEGNLPVELTSFVGRTRLLASLRQRLQESRLITVTGIGGVGKSRIALRLAHQVRRRFRDGVWYVDLARLRDPAMVYHTITAALGIADQSPREGSDTLAEWLAEREILLILDTCEHLVDACAQLTEDLLGTAPQLRILATSRRSLNAAGEHTVAVPPLAVPGEGPSENPFTNEAVELFGTRASAVVPDFAVDEDNVAAVAELCRRLDGIPLAIELAAVRLRTLSVEQILALLADRFSLLAGASRTALPRHQTLRAAIGWSHELCEPAERLLWARLSVFAGDFDIEAARQVCAGDALPAGRILDVIVGLVDKSVLLGFATPAGQRYRLIDTLRQYGGEWLDKLRETQDLRRRHRDYYLQLAELSEHSWSGPRQVHWFSRMRQEHDNIRVALDYCLSTPGEARIGLELLSALWFLWVACGFAREGVVYLERALTASPVPSRERCKALWVLAYIRSAQGDMAGALAAAEQCSTDAVRVGDSGAVLLATKMQGTAAMLQGDAKKATALLGVAIEFHRGGRELNPGLLPAIVELSMVLLAQGEFEEAETLLADCLQVCQERGELWLRSYAWYVTSLVHRETGRLDEALAACKEALRIKRRFHDVLGIVLCVDNLARLSLEAGEPERTATLLGAAQANWRTFGLPQFGSPFFTTEHEQCVKECKKLVGDNAYDEASAAGARFSLADLVEYALDDLDDDLPED